MHRALARLFAPAPLKSQAHAVYFALVQQARQPALYLDFSVPDTLDGRFDAIVVHMHLVLHRLRSFANPQAALLSQLLVETFMADMDRSIREMGVGDTGIGKRVKRMASAHLGRMKAYEDAGEKNVALAEALTRNVYRRDGCILPEAERLTVYMRRVAEALSAQPLETFLTGTPRFSL